MNSFLVAIDRAGVIVEVIWSDPAYAVSMHHPSLFQLFPEGDRRLLLKAIENNSNIDRVFRCEALFVFIGHDSRLQLWLLPMDEQILVLAIDEKLLQEDSTSKTFELIIYRLMETMKGCIEGNIFHNKASTNIQFDGIQSLNNELINTKRLLEKANAQLSILNSDLNNRLVKDALTGLVSRYQYRAEMDLSISQNPGKLGIFTFIDIDNFKQINDSYGHAVGDMYLVEFARRLMHSLRNETIKMRIAGDEFGLFTYGLDHVGSAEIADQWNQIEKEVLSSPITVDDRQLPISVSAGMAVYGVDTSDIYELIEYADSAMYYAKRDGKNGYRVFGKKEYEHLKEADNG